MYESILEEATGLGVEGMDRLISDLNAAVLSALAGGPEGAPAATS